jgi:hypothetical protein
MQSLGPIGHEVINDLAQRHGFSRDAVTHMVSALVDGNGGMAMFSHPEFGGLGQWMREGMLMLSDPVNHALKARVDSLCHEIGEILAHSPDRPVTAGKTSWWPAELGTPNATGEQNGLRYAYFAQARRLVVQTGEVMRVYDTLDHRICGFAQQQGTNSRFTVTSQHGDVDLASLPVISTGRQSPG